MVLRIILLFILVLPTVSVYSQNKIPAGETAPEKQKKMSVAVMPFNGMGELGQVTDILTERLGAELINTGEFKVMERSQMDMVLKEQGFQQTGCTSTECMVEMGQLVGVDRIIAGSIGQLGKKYTINARIINVGTGSVEKAVNVDRVCPIEELTNVMRDVALKLAGGKVENKPSPVAVNPPEKKKKADKEKEVTKRNYMRGWFTSVSAGGGDLAKAIDQSSETNLSVDAFESMTGLGGELGLGITDNFNLGVGMEFLFQTDSDDRKNDNGYDREKLELSYFVFALPINLTAYLHTPRSAAFSVSSFAGMDFYPAVGMNSYYMEERDIDYNSFSPGYEKYEYELFATTSGVGFHFGFGGELNFSESFGLFVDFKMKRALFSELDAEFKLNMQNSSGINIDDSFEGKLIYIDESGFDGMPIAVDEMIDQQLGATPPSYRDFELDLSGAGVRLGARIGF